MDNEKTSIGVLNENITVLEKLYNQTLQNVNNNFDLFWTIIFGLAALFAAILIFLTRNTVNFGGGKMPLKAIGGEINSQSLNNNFSYLESEKLGKSELYYVDVHKYGAVGDGIVDDYSAIQAAINAAGNGIVQFKAKKYLITKPLIVPSKTVLKGTAAYWNSPNEGTRIEKKVSTKLTTPFSRLASNGKTDSYDVDAIIMLDHADSTYNVGVTIKNILLLGTSDSQRTYGIYAPRNTMLRLKNVHTLYCDYGFYTFNTWMSQLDHFTARQGITGVKFADDGSAFSTGTSILFNNCFSSYMSDAGYDVYGLYYSVFNSCGADFLKTAYRMNRSSITINSCGTENSNEAVSNWASQVTVNSMKTFNMIGATSGTTAYLSARQSGVTVFNACDFPAFNSAGGSTNYNIICDNGGKMQFNLTPKPTGAGTFISYSGGAVIIENDGNSIKKTYNDGSGVVTKSVSWV